ncbi:MAG: polysaccharide deacetylase family protein, partial [Candidatus Latescibacterota bacterium]
MMNSRRATLCRRAVHVLKSLLAVAIARTGLLQLLLRLRSPGIFVCVYHRVTADDAQDPCAISHMHVTQSSFGRQLAALRQLFRVVPMSELRSILDGTRPLRQHVAVVTFDDGYRDNFDGALPILRRHQVPATFFLSIGFVDERRSFWFDRLADALRAWDRTPGERKRLRSMMPAPLMAAFDAPLRSAERLERAAHFLATLPVQERRALMKRLLPELVPPTDASRSQPLSWSEVRRMRELGMEVGAHGISHTSLTRMSAEEIDDEVRGSLQRVGCRIGERVTAFAYPNGSADPEVARLARAAGAELGFTRRPGVNRGDADPLLLGRFTVSEQSSRSAFHNFSRAYFWCEISGVFAFLSRLSHRSSRLPQHAAALRWTGPLECHPVRPAAAGAFAPPTAHEAAWKRVEEPSTSP